MADLVHQLLQLRVRRVDPRLDLCALLLLGEDVLADVVQEPRVDLLGIGLDPVAVDMDEPRRHPRSLDPATFTDEANVTPAHLEAVGRRARNLPSGHGTHYRRDQ